MTKFFTLVYGAGGAHFWSHWANVMAHGMAPIMETAAGVTLRDAAPPPSSIGAHRPLHRRLADAEGVATGPSGAPGRYGQQSPGVFGSVVFFGGLLLFFRFRFSGLRP